METVNIHEAKTHLSRLLERVAQGGSVVIAKAGKPIAKIVPLTADEARPVERLGFMAGRMSVPEDFDAMGAQEIEALFDAAP